MSLQAKYHGELSQDDFRRFTFYCNQNNNYDNDAKSAENFGQTDDDVRIGLKAIARIKGNQIGKNFMVGLSSYVNGDIEIRESVLIGPHAIIFESNHTFILDEQQFDNRSDPVAGKLILVDYRRSKSFTPGKSSEYKLCFGLCPVESKMTVWSLSNNMKPGIISNDSLLASSELLTINALSRCCM